MAYEYISLHIQDGVARLTLNRPETRNALNLPMCIELIDAFTECDSDPAIDVVLLDSAGSVFCAGADLKERQDRDAAWVRRRRMLAFAAYEKIERCAKPVICLIQGAVVGSGSEIALACDFAIASPEASFRFPEPQWGTVGATQRLQRVVGKRRAKELLFTGRSMAASEALSLGLVARLVPADRLQQEGREIVTQIRSAPPLAMMLTKQSIDLGEEMPLATGIRVELAAIERNLADDRWKDDISRFSRQIGSPDADA